MASLLSRVEAHISCIISFDQTVIFFPEGTGYMSIEIYFNRP